MLQMLLELLLLVLLLLLRLLQLLLLLISSQLRLQAQMVQRSLRPCPWPA